MKLKLRHNTLMRLITGAALLIAVPGLLFLLTWPLAGSCWAMALAVAWVC